MPPDPAISSASHRLIRPPLSVGSRIFTAACSVFLTAFLGIWFYGTGKAWLGILYSENFSLIAVAVGLTFFAFGFLGLWLLWSLRLQIFPYQFVMDRETMQIWHQWGELRSRSLAITGCTAIVVAPAWSKRSWPYYLTARCGERKVPLFRSEPSFHTETTALREGAREARRIADFLNVAVEFEEWSTEALEHARAIASI